jgi:hypothetical protein
MKRTLAALCLSAPAGTLLIGGCSLNGELAKDSCVTNADCNPGRVCSAAKECVGEPVDAGEGGTGTLDSSDSSWVPPPPVESGTGFPDDVMNIPETSGPTPPPPPSACGLPDGNVLSLTGDQAAQAIVGKWFFCSGEPSATHDQPIEFTADMHWYILVPDGSGNFVRPSGFAALQGSGTFWMIGPDSGPGVSFWIQLTPQSGAWTMTYVSFSDVPAEASATPTAKLLLGQSVYVSQ